MLHRKIKESGAVDGFVCFWFTKLKFILGRLFGCRNDVENEEGYSVVCFDDEKLWVRYWITLHVTSKF